MHKSLKYKCSAEEISHSFNNEEIYEVLEKLIMTLELYHKRSSSQLHNQQNVQPLSKTNDSEVIMLSDSIIITLLSLSLSLPHPDSVA